MGEEEAEEEDGEEEDKGRLVVFVTKKLETSVTVHITTHTSLPVPYIRVTFLFRRVSLHVLRFSLTSTPSSPPTYCTLSCAHTRVHVCVCARVCVCTCVCTHVCEGSYTCTCLYT